MILKNKLLKAIFRSEHAYHYYKKDKKYYQAIRIYKANKVIYSLLEEFLFENKQDEILICEYIYHLEDWFLQFEHMENHQSIELEDEFVFERFQSSIPYPKDFKNILK